MGRLARGPRRTPLRDADEGLGHLVVALDAPHERDGRGVEVGDDADTRVNNLLALATESCAVLATETGHWLVVRPDLADLYVDMGRVSGRGGEPLAAYGWVNQGIRPLVVLRAEPTRAVPDVEIDYFQCLEEDRQ